MLVISRQKNQAITLRVAGQEIDIIIANITPKRVLVGIEADRDLVQIKRQELPDWHLAEQSEG